MITRKDKIALAFKRFRSFLAVFRRDKRGVLGIAILVFFLTIAVGAPLITPYNPTQLPRHPENPPIAYRLARPIWYKYLPMYLPYFFPQEEFTENMDPVQDPNFGSAASIEQLNLESNAALIQTGTLQLTHSSDTGYNEKGCAEVVFTRTSDQAPLGTVKVNITKEFNYPYKIPPLRLVGQAALLVTKSEDLPLEFSIILEKEGSQRRLNWFSREINASTTTWITPSPNIDSRLWDTFDGVYVGDPARWLFSEPATYRYSIEMTFNDTRAGENVEAKVYVDDFYVRLFGNSFGLLGTDQFGRDILTQLVYGTRISLVVGLLSALFSTTIGLIVGLVAGYFGKIVDQILMRFTDMLLVIPDVPLFIVLMAVISPSVWNLIFLIALIGWTGFARIVRSQVLSLRERPFIEAAKAIGSSKFHVILRHILPNVMSLVYVSLATAVPTAIVLEAWLSFLGLYDPSVMTWGRMLHDVESEPTGITMTWWVIPPGLCIAAISLSFILLGYALDEILNPKLRVRQ